MAASLALPASALGLDLTVDSSADGSDAAAGNGVCATTGGACTLRAAFEEASTHDAPANQDSISVPAGEYLLTRDTGSKDFLIWGGLHPEDELTVTGAGAATTTIEQTVSQMRVVLSEAPLHLIGLTITGGEGVGGPGIEGFWGGGGIASSNADLALSGVWVTDNYADESGGGGIRFDRGAGAEGMLTIVDSTIVDNTTFGAGAGVQVNGPMTIEGSKIVGNSAEEITYGGGIFFDSGGGVVIPNRDLQLTNSTIAGNDAFFGGGIWFAGNELRTQGSTVSGNSAFEAGGISIGGKSATLENSTVSGNEASSKGGGILLRGEEATLTHVTVAGNTAPNAAGIGGSGGVLVRFQATILSENACTGGTFESLGFNLESGDTCSLDQSSDQPNTGAQLSPLQDNGGPTQTHALLPSSPAVDTAIEAGLAADQRGLPRPTDLASILNAPGGDGSDIGAFELQPLPAGGDGAGSPSPEGAVKPTPSQPGPDVDISAKRRQEAGRLRVRVAWEAAPCSIRLGGQATVPLAPGATSSAKSRRTFGLKPKTIQLGGGSTTVRLRFKRHRATVKAISHLLRQGGKKARKGAKVTVTATATSASGTSASTATIRLEG